jgi:hypothetical protein
MIDESFLQRAVYIRRTYLKMSNNMDFYKEKTENVLVKLDDTVKKIETLQEEYKSKENSKNKQAPEDVLGELLKILDEVEEEGKKLESLVNPLNSEIEKLAKEEQELYRLIKERHSNLSDDQIVECVKKRLIEENL